VKRARRVALGSSLGMLSHFKQMALARNAMWLFMGQGGNLLLQAATFILLARLLGVSEYGMFAGAFALVNLFTPYSALGSAMLFMRYVSADTRSARIYWGNALFTIGVGSGAITIGLMIIGPYVTHLPQSTRLFFVLTLANCLFSQVTLTAARVFQTFEKMRYSALVNSLSNLARFVALLCMLTGARHATALQWSYGVLASSLSAAIGAVILVHREIGAPTLDIGILHRRAKEGLGFSFAGTTQAAYNDLDKTLLSHFGLNSQNGFYSLAYRAIDVASTPVAAMDASVLPRYFTLSSKGIRPVAHLAWRSVAVSVALGLGIAGLTLLAAPVIPLFAGRAFSGVLTALRWLCWIPLLRGIHCLTGGALTGSGRQHFRTASQIFVAVLNLILNVTLIPKFGWIAAAFASLVSDGTLAVCNTFILLWVSGTWIGTRSHVARAMGVTS
jgi:O-antigen/teichoic acid export membrane protein